jgi:hypothetical protein
MELFAASLWLGLGTFGEIDTGKDIVLSYDEIKAQAEKVFRSEFADLVVQNVLAVADIAGDGVIHPIEMLAARFIATDIISHACTSEEIDVMTRLASEMLELPPSSPEVESIVNKLRVLIDKKGTGKMEGDEAIDALGKLRSEQILV